MGNEFVDPLNWKFNFSKIYALTFTIAEDLAVQMLWKAASTTSELAKEPPVKTTVASFSKCLPLEISQIFV